MTPARRIALLALGLAGCDLLGPRVDDARLDAAPAPDAAPDLDAAPGELDAAPSPEHVLPAGAEVPSISDDAALSNQIRLFDGLNDTTLASNGGVVARGTGKAAGVTVRYWDFGAAQLDGNFATKAPLYVLADEVGDGEYAPRDDHPLLIDSIPGDDRYSAVRQIFHVPVTSSYGGERITSVDALAEALELGLVEEPVPAGTWQNTPVVPTGTRLELGGAEEPMSATEVYGRGHVVELFLLGLPQPLRNNLVPVGQESRLLSGVPSGDPPVLTTVPDPQPVFQYGIPPEPPTSTFNYTPLVIQLDVRLADGVAPADITHDDELFTRSGNGSINGYYIDTVDSYTVTTTVSNRQIQFAEGAP